MQAFRKLPVRTILNPRPSHIRGSIFRTRSTIYLTPTNPSSLIVRQTSGTSTQSRTVGKPWIIAAVLGTGCLFWILSDRKEDIWPSGIRKRLQSALLAVEQNDYDVAVSQFKEVLRLAQLAPASSFKESKLLQVSGIVVAYGELLERMGQWEEAFKLYTSYIPMNPKEIFPESEMLRIAQISYRAGEIAERLGMETEEEQFKMFASQRLAVASRKAHHDGSTEPLGTAVQRSSIGGDSNFRDQHLNVMAGLTEMWIRRGQYELALAPASLSELILQAAVDHDPSLLEYTERRAINWVNLIVICHGMLYQKKIKPDQMKETWRMAWNHLDDCRQGKLNKRDDEFRLQCLSYQMKLLGLRVLWSLEDKDIDTAKASLKTYDELAQETKGKADPSNTEWSLDLINEGRELLKKTR